MVRRDRVTLKVIISAALACAALMALVFFNRPGTPGVSRGRRSDSDDEPATPKVVEMKALVCIAAEDTLIRLMNLKILVPFLSVFWINI